MRRTPSLYRRSPSPNRAWKRDDSEPYGYTIEQLDGREVVRVPSVKLVDRTLEVEYERRTARFDERFAQRLILAKVLEEVCLGTFRGRADKIAFKSLPSGEIEVVPYVGES